MTGYPGTWDWTEGVNHPQDDGLFVVDVKTGARKLIVSFRQMRDALVGKHPQIDEQSAVPEPHALESRRGPHLLLRARGFQRPEATVSTCR